MDKLRPCPNSLRYAKPILVIINALDFSGADFFPAMLQDSQRATLFGARTAGAGGFIDRISFPNQSIQFTASIAKRTDNSPIENLGVEPDISYEVTPDDLQNGYQGYVSASHDAVEAVLVLDQL